MIDGPSSSDISHLLTTCGLIGTFARVWLATLVTSKKEDAEKVFALKILRKTDGA